ASGSPLRGQRVTALFNACGVVRVRAPLIKETSLMAGFLLSGVRTLHRTPFDYSPQAAHPSGASASTRCSTACGVVRALPFLFYIYLSINMLLKFNKLG
ncbi:hypothetical protein, partial [Lonsdalea quercina]|uniref:hypothetical protein n=1 Tax=Lonsdalea quercina TaxID=71657 RepID=UPI003974FE2E